MTISEVGPWAQHKLENLRKYLHAYTTILSKQRFDGFHYIDAFAGPGQHSVRSKRKSPETIENVLRELASFGQETAEQRAFLAGSPRVALQIERPFSKYVFIENDKERVKELEKLQKEFPDRRIEIHQGDCNQYLLHKVARDPRIDWRRQRAVTFLDPFGMQVEWSTLEALAQTKAIEVFLNFPLGMAVQRLLLRQPDRFSGPQCEKLDRYFGSPDWFDELYRKPPRSLFPNDEPEHEKVEQSGKALLNWYRNRLKNVFGHASKAALIRNTRGGHLYYLLLATPNPTGARIASDILSAGESV